MENKTIAEFYASLDKEVKFCFKTDIKQATGWGESTFYTRIQQKESWRPMEERAAERIINQYIQKYGLPTD